MTWQQYDSEEVGPIAVFTSVVRARKVYNCHECAGRIEVGQAYERQASVCDGSWLVVQRHVYPCDYGPDYEEA